MVTALYETQIEHIRRSPIKHAFGYRSFWWLVDLDQLPVLPRGLRGLARFEARDHVGNPERSLRQNFDALLAAKGLRADRIVMLANARSLGHVFNPISVHWCFAADRLIAVIAEVHNTYGGRHAYVLQPDATGWLEADKELYVSPFHEVDGHYRMRLPFPDDSLRIDMTYHRPNALPFVATVRGSRRTGSLVALALRQASASRLVSLRIRVQGIGLYLRRLPVVPRTRIQEQIS